jgi:electron transport complex protein RnfA
MTDFFALLIGIVLVNDLVLTRLVSSCPFIGTAAAIETGIAASLAISVALFAIGALSGATQLWILEPLGYLPLRLIVASFAAVAVVSVLETAFSAFSETLLEVFSPWPLHIMVNCALLAAVLAGTGRFAAPGSGAAWGLGTGIAFSGAMLMYGELTRRLHNHGRVPRPFQGAAVALLTAGIVSLALSGLSGVLRG